MSTTGFSTFLCHDVCETSAALRGVPTLPGNQALAPSYTPQWICRSFPPAASSCCPAASMPLLPLLFSLPFYVFHCRPCCHRCYCCHFHYGMEGKFHPLPLPQFSGRTANILKYICKLHGKVHRCQRRRLFGFLRKFHSGYLINFVNIFGDSANLSFFQKKICMIPFTTLYDLIF
jgi:hypothetical protein